MKLLAPKTKQIAHSANLSQKSFQNNRKRFFVKTNSEMTNSLKNNKRLSIRGSSGKRNSLQVGSVAQACTTFNLKNDIFSFQDEEMISNFNILEKINSHHKIDKLKNQLQNSKMFLNMVIHDMRNPTVSTKEGIDSVIVNLKLVGQLVTNLNDMGELSNEHLGQLQMKEEQEEQRI